MNSVQLRNMIVTTKSLRMISSKAMPAAMKKKWRSVVGLEVHAQIASASKLFSSESTSFGEPLNSAVSYFDASIPGTLPMLNKKCVEAGIRTAIALGCDINEVSMFDRKHYFYADMPAGYQITQQRHALANNGRVTFPVIVPGKKIRYRSVKLLQLQLEQDSGKSIHDESLRRSLVDLNRAGMPLMELVFAPDLESGEEAASLIKELMLILKRLNTCSCKMEEGAMRVDANISIHQEGEPFGVRTEVKNINSLRSVSQAISYEIERQIDLVAAGESVTNETRSWDATSKRTVAMRDKEVMQDYRFMPEPNLLPLLLNMSSTDDGTERISVPLLAQNMPELPEQTRCTLIDAYNLSQETAVILVNEPILLRHFLELSSSLSNAPKKTIANFLINDLLTSCNKMNVDIENCAITTEHLKSILEMVQREEISLQSARFLLEILNSNPNMEIPELIESHCLRQISDPVAIADLCRTAIAQQTKAADQYRKGKAKAIFAIAGEVAKQSSNRANMKLVMKFLEKELRSSNASKSGPSQ